MLSLATLKLRPIGEIYGDGGGDGDGGRCSAPAPPGHSNIVESR